jgi:hypothetical protein
MSATPMVAVSPGRAPITTPTRLAPSAHSTDSRVRKPPIDLPKRTRPSSMA